ncbi:OLC1v1002232C1 [Oldenlandia corymbosa var. corymbosa]|uniref:OLC1v1002232C1 n=1 Tax=Oldenlandia corymbosa var. corymbosa TaxID=529605 RepID=A0AAV1D756_OLDCO|nr:OLC1v1002232C1 [Oldenlandia corymbosa var. corymbosa]
MNTLRSGSRSANQLRHLKQLLNNRRAISTTTAPPTFLLSNHLSPRHHPVLLPPSSSVTAVRQLRTGRDPSGGFQEMYQPNPAPIRMVVPEEEAYVIERFGEYAKTLTAGTHQFNPALDKIAYILSLKEGPFSVTHQTAFTQDNISISIDGDLFLKIVDPKLASYAVDKPKDALLNLARTAIRSEVGKMKLEQTHGDWKVLNENIAAAVNETAKEWGLQCTRSEINMKKKTQPRVKTVLAHSNGRRIRKTELEKLADKFFSAATSLFVPKDVKVFGPFLKAEWKRIEDSVAQNLERELLNRDEPAKGISESPEKLKENGGKEEFISQLDICGIQLVPNRKAEFIELVPERKAYVVERNGKYLKTLTEGIHELDPSKDVIAYEYSLEEHSIRTPQQDVVTKDNVALSVNGLVCVKVVDPKLASYAVRNPIDDAVIECAHSTLRSKVEELIGVDILFLNWGDTLNEEIRVAINEAAKDWGLQCVRYKIEYIIYLKP